MSPASASAPAAVWYRVRREQRHRRRNHPLLWTLGWIARIASGLGAIGLLQQAESNGSLLLAMFVLLGGIATLAGLHTLGAMLNGDTSRLLLPLPLTPASRWRLMVWDAILAAGGPACAILLATALTTSWQWTLMLACWIPVACTLGAAIACTCSWSLSGLKVRWRALLILLGTMLAVGASLWMMARAPRQLSPLLFLPDAIILIGLSLGPGAGFVGRVMPPILRQVATTPPTTFALAPRLTARAATILERRRHPIFAILRKDLLTHTRDAFILIRIALVLGSLPLAIVLHPRFSTVPAGAGIAILVILLTCYGIVELSPSPFGGEGNRLLLTLQTDASPASLLAGKILGVLLFNLPQAWATVTIVSIGTGAGFPAWLFALTVATVTVSGLGVVLTCISAGDIDLERRVEDRSEALLAEHLPIGIKRMLGLSITGLIAVGSIAILLQTPPALALPLLCLLHAGCAIVIWRFAARRLAFQRR